MRGVQERGKKIKKLITLLLILCLLVSTKSSSGTGGAIGSPSILIAHYKFNENTSGDSTDLIGGGDFATADWDGDDPDPTYWTVTGEVTTNPEVSEVGTGEGHGGVGTGYCNLYTTGDLIKITQNVDLVVGRKYRFSVNVDTITTGGLKIEIGASGVDFNGFYSGSETGTQGGVFVAVTGASTSVELRRNTGATDITFDDVSIKLLAVEDSSGNDHDGLAQQATDQIHQTGKNNGAFDFTPNDYIEIPDHDDFTPALTPFSISAWVYMHSATSFAITSKGILDTTNAEWRLRLTTAADKLEFLLFDESVATCLIGKISDVALTSYENQWIHLIATYDGGILSSGIRLYLNGTHLDAVAEEYSPELFVAVENLSSDVWIGRYSTDYADGLIDNVMFFSVELSLDEVKRLYNNRNGTEILQEIDSVIIPRRSNTSPLALRKRYEN